MSQAGNENITTVADALNRGDVDGVLEAAGVTRRGVLATLAAGAVTAAGVSAGSAAATVSGLTPPDRRALESYAAWLHMERRMLCSELYPHMGSSAEKFVFADNAGYHWHVDAGLPAASTRATAVLRLVGVDWQARETHFIEIDNGNRPPLPANWPEVDGDLRQALEDMRECDRTIAGLIKTYGDDDRPEYDVVSDRRYNAIDTLIGVQASSLTGLLAKAEALQEDELHGDFESHQALAVSLGEDISRLGAKAVRT